MVILLSKALSVPYFKNGLVSPIIQKSKSGLAKIEWKYNFLLKTLISREVFDSDENFHRSFKVLQILESHFKYRVGT